MTSFRQREFSVDSQGTAEEIPVAALHLDRKAGAILDLGDSVVHLASGTQLSKSKKTGRHFFLDDSGYRAYHLRSNTWHEIPQGEDPTKFMDTVEIPSDLDPRMPH